MITFVNDFTVIPGKQLYFLREIQNIYLEVVRHQPGFISARLLKSDDDTKVTVIALWESQEQLESMKHNLGFENLHETKFLEASVSSDAHIYSKFVEIPGTRHKHNHQKKDERI